MFKQHAPDGVVHLPPGHTLTDYVFDGSERRAYGTQDATRPLGIYGKSKLAGELAVSASELSV